MIGKLEDGFDRRRKSYYEAQEQYQQKQAKK